MTRVVLCVTIVCLLTTALPDAAAQDKDKQRVFHVPSTAIVIAGAAPKKIPEGAAVWVKAGAKASMTVQNCTVFVEPGAAVTVPYSFASCFIVAGVGAVTFEVAEWSVLHKAKGAKVVNSDRRLDIQSHDAIKFAKLTPFKLTGIVKDEAGKPVAGMNVGVGGLRRTYFDTQKTDAEGRFTFNCDGEVTMILSGIGKRGFVPPDAKKKPLLPESDGPARPGGGL